MVGATKLKSDWGDKSDPFCEIKISNGDKKTIQTDRIEDNEEPRWNK